MNTITDRIKGAWRSRTVLYGLLIAVLGQAQASRPDVDIMLDAFLRALHLEWVRPYIWALVGFGVVILRFITTQPLEQK